MLFRVKYVGIEIEKVQSALEHFFLELEKGTQPFSANLFPAEFENYLYRYGNPHNPLRNYVKIFRDIFDLYHSAVLTPAERASFVKGFFESNDIEGICNDPTKGIVHYADLKLEIQNVVAQLISLYDKLPEIIDKKKHFEKFRSLNGKICSICGLETGLQYDHYFPTGKDVPIFPYSSINPKNLIPICQGCNGPKSKKLVIYATGKNNSARIIALFPYADIETWKHLKFSLTNIEKPEASNNFGKWEVIVSVKQAVPNDLKAKINHWKDFYEIEKRFSNDLGSNINIWIALFKEQKISLTRMLRECKPTESNIRATNGVILQWLFFDLLNRDANLQNILLSPHATRVDPNDLLREQLV